LEKQIREARCGSLCLWGSLSQRLTCTVVGVISVEKHTKQKLLEPLFEHWLLPLPFSVHEVLSGINQQPRKLWSEPTPLLQKTTLLWCCNNLFSPSTNSSDVLTLHSMLPTIESPQLRNKSYNTQFWISLSKYVVGIRVRIRNGQGHENIAKLKKYKTQEDSPSIYILNLKLSTNTLSTTAKMNLIYLFNI